MRAPDQIAPISLGGSMATEQAAARFRQLFSSARSDDHPKSPAQDRGKLIPRLGHEKRPAPRRPFRFLMFQEKCKTPPILESLLLWTVTAGPAFHRVPGAVVVSPAASIPWIHLLGQPLEQPLDAQAPSLFGLMQHLAQVQHVGGAVPRPGKLSSRWRTPSRCNQCRNMRKKPRWSHRSRYSWNRLQPFLPLISVSRKLSAVHAEKVGGKAASPALVTRQRRRQPGCGGTRALLGLNRLPWYGALGMFNRSRHPAFAACWFSMTRTQSSGISRPLPDPGVAVSSRAISPAHDRGRDLFGRPRVMSLPMRFQNQKMKRRLGLAIRGERSLVGLAPSDGSWKSCGRSKGLGARAEDLVEPLTTSRGFGSPVSPKVKRGSLPSPPSR